MGVDVNLTGRRALVTGAGQGVGEAIARLLAAAGAEVAVNDVVADRAETVATAISADGARAVAVPFDVTDHEAVLRAVEGLGGVDVLVNNAGNAGAGTGFGALDPFVATRPADWEPYLQVNLYGVMHCVHAAAPAMIEQGWGRIVTIISDAGRVGEANMAAYAAAKAGAAGFCRSVAREVARHGVTVNNISLGTMRTPLTSAVYDSDEPEARAQVKNIMRNYLVRRPGEPDDVAGMVLYLASDLSAWVTGQTYPVNGGVSVSL